MTTAEVEAKFKRLVGRRLSASATRKLLATLWRLEKLDDVSELLPLLRVRYG